MKICCITADKKKCDNYRYQWATGVQSPPFLIEEYQLNQLDNHISPQIFWVFQWYFAETETGGENMTKYSLADSGKRNGEHMAHVMQHEQFCTSSEKKRCSVAIAARVLEGCYLNSGRIHFHRWLPIGITASGGDKRDYRSQTQWNPGKRTNYYISPKICRNGLGTYGREKRNAIRSN